MNLGDILWLKFRYPSDGLQIVSLCRIVWIWLPCVYLNCLLELRLRGLGCQLSISCKIFF